jgi:ATP-binding cassette subfamily B protein
VQGLSGIVQALQQATGAMRRVDELLAQQPAIADAPNARPLPRLAHAIRLEDVTLSYTGLEPHLDGLSLEIPAGAKVALVGPSGCGKSTVLNVIMRLYDPDKGTVTFDGVDLRDATLSSVRQQIGVVFQESFLFDTTLRENIRMGRLDATDEEVEAAAAAAEIHEQIMSMPEGYHTVVGERGSRLSGGQRQRIAIARAILRNPTILILDEATSALDPQTEAAINATLDRLAKGRTTISVTHRLTAAAYMDKIFVLERGRLAEEGRHEELLRRDGLYSRLWKEQTGPTTGAYPLLDQEAESLGNVPLFAGLAGDVLEALTSQMGTERYAPGDTVISQGDRGELFYIIRRGEAEVIHVDEYGTERRLAELRDGDYFGEMALLQDAPRVATVRATSALLLATLSRRDLAHLCTMAPGVRDVLERTVQERRLALTAV